MFRGKNGVNTETLAGDVVLVDGSAGIQRLDPDGASRTVQVFPQGAGRSFFIVNTGTVAGTDLLAVTDKDSAAVVTIDAGESAIVYGSGTGLVSLPINQSSSIVELSMTLNSDAAAGTDEDPFYAMLGGDGGSEIVKSRWVQDSSDDVMSFEMYGGASGTTEKSPTVVIGVPGTTTASMDATLRLDAAQDDTTAKSASIVLLGQEERLTVTAPANLVLSDSTMSITSASGVVTEAGMVSLNWSPSGLITLDAGSNLTLTATTGVIVGDAGNPTFDWAGAGAVTASGNPTFNLGTSQVDVDGLLVASGGVTMDGGVLTFTGTNLDLDPTGTVALDMDAGQALTVVTNGVACSWTHTATGAAHDLTIAVAGAVDSSLVLSSAGTGADAVQLLASGGGLDITCASGSSLDISDGVATVSMASGALTEASLASINLTPSGAASILGGAASSFGVSGTDAGGLVASFVSTNGGAGTATSVLTAGDAVQLGDVTNNPTIDLPGTGAVTASGNPTWNFGTSQADFDGNLDANAGLDVSGGALTVANGQQLQTSDIREIVAGGGITVGAGEIIGVPLVLSYAVAYNTSTGAAFTIPDGEEWIIHDVWFVTAVDWDGNGTVTVGDGNDADGFLNLGNADLDPAYDESGGVTGWTAGSKGLISTNRGVYQWDDTNDSPRFMRYAPSGADETIDATVTTGTSTAGNGTLYCRYTRIS